MGLSDKILAVCLPFLSNARNENFSRVAVSPSMVAEEVKSIEMPYSARFATEYILVAKGVMEPFADNPAAIFPAFISTVALIVADSFRVSPAVSSAAALIFARKSLSAESESFAPMSLRKTSPSFERFTPDVNGPVCPIYGFGMIIVLFTLSPLVDNLLLLYIGGVILPSVLELAGGWALYKLYHTRWWDYSDFPFNIGGYICLEFSLLWGVGTVVVMKAVHPVIAGFVEMVPQMVGFVLMCILYACYAADVVVTAFAASDLARELDALEKVADSMHAVSDAMTELLGTTAMDVDQKMDESRLQLKLAAAEARDNAARLSPRDAAAALRAKADEAMEAARKSSQEARLNASEAATAVKLAAKGTAERTAELLRLEQLAEELQARSEEMRARTRSSKYFGKGRMLRAYPKLRHGEKHRSLDELRERLKYERRH